MIVQGYGDAGWDAVTNIFSQVIGGATAPFTMIAKGWESSNQANADIASAQAASNIQAAQSAASLSASRGQTITAIVKYGLFGSAALIAVVILAKAQAKKNATPTIAVVTPVHGYKRRKRRARRSTR